MTLIDKPAVNEVEEALIKGRNGSMSVDDIIGLLINEKLYFPSMEKCQQDGQGFAPLIFDRDGTPMVSLFTNKERMEHYNSHIKDVLLIPFKEYLAKGPDDYGLVINPGYTVGMEIQAYGLKNIKRNFLR